MTLTTLAEPQKESGGRPFNYEFLVELVVVSWHEPQPGPRQAP